MKAIEKGRPDAGGSAECAVEKHHGAYRNAVALFTFRVATTMTLKTLKHKVNGLCSGEDRGVSPVIGVVLMVAITVILAAVIGAFVLGLGDGLGNSTPTAQISTDVNADDEVVFTHNGGDTISKGDMHVVVAGDTYELSSIEGDFSTESTIKVPTDVTDDENNLTTDPGTDSATPNLSGTVSLVYDDGSSSSTLSSIDV